VRDPFVPGQLDVLADHLRTRRTSLRPGLCGDIPLRVGLTNGCFELFHAGHAESLRSAAGMCDLLIVGINSDASMERIKRKPFVHDEHRAAVVSAIKGVDYVVIFDEDTPMALMDALKPDVYIKGGDYEDKQDSPTFAHAKSLGCDVICTEYITGMSTTKLLEKIRKT